ncbi:conserved hypothetical protein [Uncinocarpus reesii 1704]|uniref:Phospholipid/glycerol acyltransferase domain-containing protein n=1 Tax=Uncinocarpus reesii (strain UAMH 1704) TaxID=336963 RepID=C4JMU9_UNCRE|nr:uncharacterized protein UREG_04157 [Uncinocarpus reesii 1704]EEP79311.1 conserved hypothetical protein [Uncinocarpus reesii 1704]
MSSNGPIRRKPPVLEPGPSAKTRSQPETTRHKYARPEKDYGLFLQIIRSLLILAWFNCCCFSIVVTQAVGLPLYLINKRWFYSYMAMTKRSFGITITALTEWCSPTPVRISGDSSVQGQFSLLKDGRVATKFPERLVLIANHQVYTDWLYLWWVTYTNDMHGYIYIILKESLKYIPFIGQGMMLYGFIFMARKWIEDKPRLQHRLQKLKTKHGVSPEGLPLFDPMWLLIFPEGTNLSRNTKDRSDAYCQKQGIAPSKHILLPRSTGLFFCLQQLRGTVDYVYDCTIGYEGQPKDSYAEAHFTIRSTYLRGRPPKSVNFYWRRFSISDIPLTDQKEFEDWIYKRWEEKDRLLDQFIETGRFPPFEDMSASNTATKEASEQTNNIPNNGYIESEIKLGHWAEAAKIFTILIALGLVLRFVPRVWS